MPPDSQALATPAALTLAGSDSGAGAGIQADLKTFAACGVYGTSVITAVTAQNTRGVQGLWPVPPDSLRAQLQAVLSDMPVVAMKTGLLTGAGCIDLVAQALSQRRAQSRPLALVIDPVLASSSGYRFLPPAALQLMREVLIPQARVITPNLQEAAALLDEPVAQNLDQARAQAGRLLALGAQAVLLTGGHLPGACAVDVFCDSRSLQLLSARRVETRNSHGTGCTLSAAITAYLALGHSPESACRKAKDYLQQALLGGVSLNLGAGSGPLNHFPERLTNRSMQESL